ncbi:MAG: NAD(P)(+) transhydrogenase (Re/Si-specific) subunit alpha [Trueperaceae bacterium]|nr:NAD(P)(+) transhydrogenase (Re/Si-specific) subunit alpha [Trueperaceae bacterium]
MVVTCLPSPPPERRLALVPVAIEKLVKLSHVVRLPAGYGGPLHLSDADLERAGAEVVAADAAASSADVVLVVSPPSPKDLEGLKRGATVVGFLDPFFSLPTVRALAEGGFRALCVELMPRTTYAQKMDALSSQASLAGYAAVLAAAERIDKVLPMMSTPAGTIAPARVFVLGVGVAGLQAIATAKRLGARVDAYDTRPVVAEQVRSLGARFVEFDLGGEQGQTAQGYAQALTDEQLARQREQMAKVVAQSDIVITTAQVFGRAAPRLLSAAAIAGMKPGSVVVDLAASTGGNVEGTVAGEEVVTDEGVRLMGLHPLPAAVARDASLMYAANLVHLIAHAWTDDALKSTDDEIVDGVLLIDEGAVRHDAVRARLEADR